jgi:hypothetical protein
VCVPHHSNKFSKEELLRIKPEDLCRYFRKLAYGNESPSPDSLPKMARSNTILFHKKVLSYYMPRKNMQWDDITMMGNPTKSVEVNNLIQIIKKSEVRKQGAPSQAKRAIEYDEFLSILTIIRTSDLIPLAQRYRLSSILTIQWHLIGRIDDIMKLQLRNLTCNTSNNYTLNAQLCWSKNIREERDSPIQLLLPAIDDRICVILNLDVYLECFTSDFDADTTLFLYGNGVDGDRAIRSYINKIFGLYT